MRVKALIAYDGSAYKGFQKQKSTSKTITTSIEVALKSLGITSNIIGSGRTDAGVHATGQVIHFDLPPFWTDLTKLKIALNQKLYDIKFKHISQVKEDFHSRFHAKKRLYRYVFKTQRPSLFEQKYISYYEDFNIQDLEEVLEIFIGKYDFKYFHKKGSFTHNNIREIYKASYRSYKNYHFIYFQANGFLRSQVRMMIASAMLYAQGKSSLKAVKEQLKGEYKHSSKLAPAEGLYLARVLY